MSCALLPLELSLLRRSELEKNELYQVLAKIKSVAREIIRNLVRPLSPTDMHRHIAAWDVADFSTTCGISKAPSASCVSQPSSISTNSTGKIPARSATDSSSSSSYVWPSDPSSAVAHATRGDEDDHHRHPDNVPAGPDAIYAWIWQGTKLDHDGLLVQTAMHIGLHGDPKHLPAMTTYHAEMRQRLCISILELNLQCSFEAGASPLLLAPTTTPNPLRM
ncbi:fungal specific transcription factor domain-containing protein [Aspergillus tanneri]|uniref:Uncharacterized protein n=1 Tax=Aspergillus tanneri TaxID=1220188 RepID=A0A5M9MDF0_9EURO|nr:uncharacterized protein ATNIH1004_010540 [Aspergillus tanneri]KAA8643766.1 hypothetical protein ATNIH1004_010540 [Aspergillus tanneri]